MMMRRFVKDESGMTMGLAIMMIALIGVMGAGLLTFASKDLNSVVEVNRGQRAFEVADAGIGVAKRQLTSDCGAGGSGINCTEHYDDREAEVWGLEDIQWSEIKGGVTLNDLDGDGNAITSDSVNVTIRYSHTRDLFRVISEGTYTTGNGVAKRKIEALLKAVGGSLGGQGIGHPLYYTPSDITIEGDPAAGEITISGMSMFSEQDIIIEGLTSTRATPTEPEGRAFKDDYESSTIGVFQVPSTNDFLGDWYSPGYPIEKRGNWNTERRMGHSGTEIGAYKSNLGCNRSTRSCVNPGLAAEGKICAVPAGSDIGECRDPISGAAIPSIADGVYAYDCTTGPVEVAGCTRDSTKGEVSRGKQLTFLEKQPLADGTWGMNDPGTITYPFPKQTPNDRRLKRMAQEQQEEGSGGYYYEGCTPPWSTIFGHPEQDENDVIFIDAGSCNAPIEMSFGGTQDGMMVVWCGDLHHTNDTKWRGITMNLIGDGSAFGSSNCEGDMSKGVYRIDEGSEMWGWLYAEGGTDTRSGIVISSAGTDTSGQGTTLHFRSGATWNFLDEAFSTPSIPSGFSAVGWRELYE